MKRPYAGKVRREPSEEIDFLENHEFSKLYFIGFKDELKGFIDRTDRSFAEIADKYGDISKELKEFRVTVKGFLDTSFLNIWKLASARKTVSPNL